MMRKLVFFMLVVLVSLPLFAQLENSNIVVSDATVLIGETVEISVSTSELLEGYNVSAFQFDLSFDSSKLTYVGYDIDGLMTDGSSVAINDANPGLIMVGCASAYGFVGAGSIINLEFSTSATGTSNLVISDFLFNAIEITNLTNGLVTINNLAPTIEIDVTEITQPGSGNQSFNISNIGDAGSILDYSISTGYTMLSSVNSNKINDRISHMVYAYVFCYVESSREEWLSVNPISGDVAYGASDEITVSFDDTGLDAGDYTANITIASNGGNDLIIPVTLTVETGGNEHPEDVTFEAWIVGREDEILTQDSGNCDWDIQFANHVSVQVESFVTPWAIGETFHLRVQEVATGNIANAEVVLSEQPYDYIDNMIVSPLPPASPIDITISVLTDESGHVIRNISWSAVDGASYYNIYGCSTPNGEFVQINTEPITETTFESAGGSTLKFFKITANN